MSGPICLKCAIYKNWSSCYQTAYKVVKDQFQFSAHLWQTFEDQTPRYPIWKRLPIISPFDIKLKYHSIKFKDARGQVNYSYVHATNSFSCNLSSTKIFNFYHLRHGQQQFVRAALRKCLMLFYNYFNHISINQM